MKCLKKLRLGDILVDIINNRKTAYASEMAEEISWSGKIPFPPILCPSRQNLWMANDLRLTTIASVYPKKFLRAAWDISRTTYAKMDMIEENPTMSLHVLR